MRRGNPTSSERLSSHQADRDHIESANPFEMAEVGRSDRPARGDRSRSHETVVGTDINPCGHELRPEPGVRAGAAQIKRQWREGDKNRFDEGFPPSTVLRCGSMHTVQQFRRSDRRDPNLLSRAEPTFEPAGDLGQGALCRTTAKSSLELDENGGV